MRLHLTDRFRFLSSIHALAHWHSNGISMNPNQLTAMDAAESTLSVQDEYLIACEDGDWKRVTELITSKLNLSKHPGAQNSKNDTNAKLGKYLWMLRVQRLLYPNCMMRTSFLVVFHP